MGKAVSNFNFHIKTITQYLLPLIEYEDSKNVFKKDFELWENFTTLLIEGMKMYSELGREFSFPDMFKDLTGKIPYNGRRKRLEKKSGILVFNLLNEAIVDYFFNLKIDINRRKIILTTSKKYRNDAIKMINKTIE